MKEAATKFLGLHDFRNFCKKDSAKEIVEYERTIFQFDIEPASKTLQKESEIEQLSSLFAATIKGSAFLWHQVRCMMQVLLKIGAGL